MLYNWLVPFHVWPGTNREILAVAQQTSGNGEALIFTKLLWKCEKSTRIRLVGIESWLLTPHVVPHDSKKMLQVRSIKHTWIVMRLRITKMDHHES